MIESAIEIPHKPRHGERFAVDIDRIDERGDGVGTFDALVGPQQQLFHFTAHVRRAIPGDRVLMQVSRVKKKRIDGWVADVELASPMRREPRCPHFADQPTRPGCGGCNLQLLDHRHQLAVKERRLKQLLGNAGIDPGLIAPVATASDGWFYRNKMEFSFAGAGDEFGLGMHPAGFRYEVIQHDTCLLMSEWVASFIPAAQAWAKAYGEPCYRAEKGFWRNIVIREGKRTGDRLVELVTTHLDTIGDKPPETIAHEFADWLDGEYGDDVTSVFWTQHRAVRGEPTRMIETHLAGEQTIREELVVADRTLGFEIAPRAFFQTNTHGAELLYGMVVEDAAPDGSGTALDLYSGTGTIGICLAGSVDRVVGIELVAEAVENARQNALANGVDNAEFHAGDVGDVLGELQPQADVVVVDPPRAGLLPQAHEQLAKIDAQRLVYVSCNPKALARDLPLLVAAGWTIERLRPVDMFPQTAHVETVACLTR